MPRGQRDKVSAGSAKQVSDDAEMGCGGGDHRWSGDAGRSFPLAYPISIGVEEQVTASGEGKWPDASDKRGNSREGVDYSLDHIRNRCGDLDLSGGRSQHAGTQRALPRPSIGTGKKSAGPRFLPENHRLATRGFL
jgi:hypothetical protein